MKYSLKICLVLILVSALFVHNSQAQNIKDSSLSVSLVKISYGAQMPGGDLAKRFGWNSSVGLGFTMKNKKGLVFGFDGSFIFGKDIKEDGILDSIKTSQGFVINQNGNPSEVRLYERGFTASLHIGKLFNVLAANKNSGIIIYGGPTYLTHKIRIDDIGHQSPQLVKEYVHGYDRLTGGLGFHEFVGYTYLSNNKLLNFFAGFDFVQGFTKSLRSYNYDTMTSDTQKRFDMLSGFRIGWILPIYNSNTVSQTYYH